MAFSHVSTTPILTWYPGAVRFAVSGQSHPVGPVASPVSLT
jgi:hypothetical protein